MQTCHQCRNHKNRGLFFDLKRMQILISRAAADNAHPQISTMILVCPRKISRKNAIAGSLVCGGLIALATTQAAAKWQFETSKDVSGRETKSAYVTAQARDAVLQLDCENGTQLLSIAADRSFERGMIGSVITLDRRPPRSGLLKVYSGRTDIPIFDLRLVDLTRSKRLSIELQPITGTSSRYVFDTSGARSAVKAVWCGPRRPSLLRRLESKFHLPPLRLRSRKTVSSTASQQQ